MSPAPPPDPAVSPPVVLFDGACGLCAKVVTFVITHERRPTLHFASLQSSFAARVCAGHPEVAGLDSVLLLEGDRVHARSEAVLRIGRHLRWPWRGIVLFRWVPRLLADAVYEAIARRRHRFFGSRDGCLVPAALPGDRVVA